MALWDPITQCGSYGFFEILYILRSIENIYSSLTDIIFILLIQITRRVDQVFIIK